MISKKIQALTGVVLLLFSICVSYGFDCKFNDSTIGSGKAAKSGDDVEIKYECHKFSGNSIEEEHTQTFMLGSQVLCTCIENAIIGMKPGGERIIVMNEKCGRISTGYCNVTLNKVYPK